MKTQIEINNYGLIKHISKEMSSGNLYFVKASNSEGKTTFTRAFLDVIQGQSKNKNRLSFGEKEGNIKTKHTFNGGDNKVYDVRLDFNDKGKEKFTIITPDNIVSNRKTDVSAIFKYNHFSVDDWFGWGMTAEGRRKQADIIKLLLPEGKQSRLKEIDSLINTKNGTLYLKRRDSNNEFKALLSLDKSFDEREEKILDNGEDWIKGIGDIKTEYEEAKSAVDKNDTYIQTIEREKNSIEDTDSEIKELERKLESLKEKNIKSFASIKEAKEKTENVPTKEKLEDLSVTLNKYQNGINAYNVLLEKKKDVDYNTKNIESKRSDYIQIDNQINELRAENKNIITESNTNLRNIVINNGEVFYEENGNELPFIEDNISYSKGGIIVLKLMTKINKKLPIWFIGKAAEYDNKSKEELLKIAKENDGIIVADQVVGEDTKLHIEIYDKTKDEKPRQEQKEEKQNETEIF